MANPRLKYTKEDAKSDLPAILGAAGLDEGLAAEAELLHYHHNALFLIHSRGIVFRNVRPGVLAEGRAHKVAQLGVRFRQLNAPTVRLSQEFTQPINVGDLWATIWEEADRKPAEQVSGYDMGVALKRFHQLDVSGFRELPRWVSPLEVHKLRIQQGLAKGLITQEEHDNLAAWTQDLDQQLEEARLELVSTIGPMHGDAQIANIVFRNGEPIFCDFDSTGIGPPQVDLAVTAVNARHFDKEQRHREAVAAYGADILEDRFGELFIALRENKLVTASILELDDHPAMRIEFEKRYRSIFDGGREIWVPYATAMKLYDDANPNWRNTSPTDSASPRTEHRPGNTGGNKDNRGSPGFRAFR